MAKFDVLDMNGKKVSTVELSDAARFRAAAKSRGARRARATPARALPAARSGHMAASRWAPSPAITATG